jgi:hypothetical protein
MMCSRRLYYNLQIKHLLASFSHLITPPNGKHKEPYTTFALFSSGTTTSSPRVILLLLSIHRKTSMFPYAGVQESWAASGYLVNWTSVAPARRSAFSIWTDWEIGMTSSSSPWCILQKL